jgi:hypothetical protein
VASNRQVNLESGGFFQVRSGLLNEITLDDGHAIKAHTCICPSAPVSFPIAPLVNSKLESHGKDRTASTFFTFPALPSAFHPSATNTPATPSENTY